MGEKQGKGDDNKNKEKPAAKPEGGEGEKKKKDGAKGEGGGDGKGKKDGSITVVLKVDMHCDGCAKKIKRCVRAFDGVETVTADVASGKLTAVGKIDAWKLREHVEVKTHKKVVLVSPTDPPKKEEAKKEEKKGGGEKKEDKAPKEATVVLNIRLHCEGCIKRIRRTIFRFQGVDSVSVDSGKDQVTVKGTMDTKGLVLYLQDKLKRNVEIDQPKKGDGGKGGGGGGGEKGGKAGGGGDGEKKKDGGGGGGGDEKAAKAASAAPEANKLDYLYQNYGGGAMYTLPPNLTGPAAYQFLQQQQQQQQQMMMMQQQHHGFPFGGQQVVFPQHYAVAPLQHVPHPPQLFSDENPNACSIM